MYIKQFISIIQNGMLQSMNRKQLMGYRVCPKYVNTEILQNITELLECWWENGRGSFITLIIMAVKCHHRGFTSFCLKAGPH